jgi:flagellar secretion chaperone FliS
MSHPIHQNYRDLEVLNAGPVRLVSILYRAAVDAVRAARRHLAAGAIGERSRQITKAHAIVHELLRSLDREKGGEIARSLNDLYAYMSTRLIEANARQIDAPLADAERLLSTLIEAWSEVREVSAAPSVYQPESAPYRPITCAY